MYALILLTTIGQAPADEWRPFTKNPAYEVRGHVDARGVFRYTQSRLRAAGSGVNYGLILPGPVRQLHGDAQGEVRGTDPALGRMLAESLAEKPRPEVAQARPCPGPGPCPKPAPAPHLPRSPDIPARLERDMILIVVAVGLAAIVVGLVLVLVLAALFMVARAVLRYLFPPNPV